MRLRYDLDSMTPGILVSPRPDQSLRSVPSSQIVVTNLGTLDDHADLTLTGGLNSFTLRGSIVAIRALLTDATAVLDQVQADGNTHYKIKENNMPNHQPDTNKSFSLNISTDAVPDVSLEHDSTTDEVHIKFFNVDNELVLDLGGLLNDVGPLLSGLSIIAKYRALRTGLNKAVAEDDLVGAVEILSALKDLQRTPEFDSVFENVDITEKDPEREQESLLPESGIAVLTGKDAEALLAMLDEKFNGE